jgi:hypothetical protein
VKKPLYVFATIAALSFVAGCGGQSQTQGINSRLERPETIAHVGRLPGQIFETLPSLVETSEIVVLGTVQSAERGHSTADDGGPPYARDVVVGIEKQFYGPTVGDTIVVDQLGYEVSELEGADVPFETHDHPWLYPGDRAVFFLKSSSLLPEDHYTILAGPGQLVVRGDGRVSTRAEDPIARKLAGQDWPSVEQQIEKAVREVEE